MTTITQMLRAIIQPIQRWHARLETPSEARAREYVPGPVCWVLGLYLRIGNPRELADQLLHSHLRWYWTSYDIPSSTPGNPHPFGTRYGPVELVEAGIPSFVAAMERSDVVDLYAVHMDGPPVMRDGDIAEWLHAFRAGRPSPIMITVEDMGEPDWKIVCMDRAAPEEAVNLLEQWGTGPRKTSDRRTFTGPMKPPGDSFTPPLV